MICRYIAFSYSVYIKIPSCRILEEKIIGFTAQTSKARSLPRDTGEGNNQG